MNTNGDLAVKFIGDGSEDRPAEAFFSEESTGVYRDTPDPDPGYVISVKGNKRLKVSDTKIESFVPFAQGDVSMTSLEIGPSPDDETFDLKMGQKTGFIVEPYGSDTHAPYLASLRMNNWDTLIYFGDDGDGFSSTTLQNVDGGSLVLTGNKGVTMSGGGDGGVVIGNSSSIMTFSNGITFDDTKGTKTMTLGVGFSGFDGHNTDFKTKSLTSNSIIFNQNTNSSIGYQTSAPEQMFLRVNGSTKLSLATTQCTITDPSLFLSTLACNGLFTPSAGLTTNSDVKASTHSFSSTNGIQFSESSTASSATLVTTILGSQVMSITRTNAPNTTISLSGIVGASSFSANSIGTTNITGAGLSTFSGQPRVIYTMSSAQPITANTDTVCIWNVTELTFGGFAAPSAGTFTIPVNGCYLIIAQGAWNIDGVGGVGKREMWIRYNGVVLGATRTAGSASTITTQRVERLKQCFTGDTITIFVNHSSTASPVTFGTQTPLEGFVNIYMLS